MTACAIETGTQIDTDGAPASGTAVIDGAEAEPKASVVPGARVTRRSGFSIAVDGSYAACLADAGDGCWYPERWTLDGPEPYTVPLPGNQPEEADSQPLPLPDGRVLIRRRVADRHDLALLYPTGPGTGELRVGFLYGEEVRLLPPLATGSAYALTYADGISSVWLVHGGPGLEKLAEIEGRCTGGVWLDREGRTLALDRELDGRTKAVAVDLAGGVSTPLLQITDDSDDRVLLADPDSGLLLVRSNAPGTERLGWGVLGSRRPVRFPESLRAEGAQGAAGAEGAEDAAGAEDTVITPVSVQPGQLLMPESCAVALRIDGPGGTVPALWRPDGPAPVRVSAPQGWLAGAVTWSPRGTLRLPYATPECPCGLADVEPVVPLVPPEPTTAPAVPPAEPKGPGPGSGWRKRRALPRVLPLQQAPLAVQP
ncbi:hypothetical protein [Streptomyces humicola]